jgi:predicted DNA-binding transcriptional regulator YafY
MTLTFTISPDGRAHLRAQQRLILIHEEISRGKFPNSATLARQLEISTRTAKRALEFLRVELNAPLKYEPGRRGYRYLNPGWQLPPVTLTEGDLLAFFIAENALRAIGHTPEALRLKNALGKLVALLPAQVSVNLTTLGENVSFQNLPFATADPQILTRLAQAAINQEIVEFDYYSPHRQSSSHRRAGVLTLHNFAGDWFAICLDCDKNAERDFHVGRMKNLRETSLPFEPPKNWNAEEYLRTGFFMMRGGKPTTIEILFDAHQAQWMRERRDFHPDEQREEMPDGSFKLSFKIGEDGLEAVARFCMTYADHCKVLNPPRLKKLIRKKLAKGLEINR